MRCSLVRKSFTNRRWVPLESMFSLVPSVHDATISLRFGHSAVRADIPALLSKACHPASQPASLAVSRVQRVKVNIKILPRMYEDSWYSYAPESHSTKDEQASQASGHRRRESLLKQPNVSHQPPRNRDFALTCDQGSNQISSPQDPILEIFEESAGLKGPPKATLARRAKSYNDFYDADVTFLSKETAVEKSKDMLEESEFSPGLKFLANGFEDLEEELLDESQEQYRSASYSCNQHVTNQ